MTDFTKLTEEEKNELVKRAYEYAYRYEAEYGNCAQCVIGAIQDVFGIVDDAVFQAAHGLAGGVGLASKGSCGAMSGAVMVISSLQGREKSEFATGKNRRSYKMSKLVADKFEEEYGGVLCHEVQEKIMGRSFDLNKKEDYIAFELAGGHKDKCTSVVGNAAKYVAEMIVNGEI